MLRGLRALRVRANQPGWQAEFDNHITVITANISADMISLDGHWTTVSKHQKVQYCSMDIKDWVTAHEDWLEISQSLTNAIFTILERNKPWIISDLSKIHESLKVQKRARSKCASSSQDTKRMRLSE